LWSDAASHPLTEATEHLVSGDAEPSAFAWGLDRLLDGVLAGTTTS
jgi:TetR/AcrR family tetracycline transcriptional repressor